MLFSKFIVPATRGIYGNVSQSTTFLRRICRKAARDSCDKSQNIKGKVASPKSEEYRKKLANCPKASHELLCCRKLFSKPAPECKAKIVGDDYQEAYRDTTIRMKRILTEVEEESKSILVQLEKDIETAKTNESAQFRELFRDMEGKLEKLISLDPCFGSLTRKSAMLLNAEAREAFEELQRDVIPSVERIKRMLVRLQCDALICIDRAKNVVLLCRKSKHPQELAKCIEENASHAVNMLDQTSEDARARLNEIKGFRDEILKCHKIAANEVVYSYREKAAAFAKYLDNCIAAAKRTSY